MREMHNEIKAPRQLKGRAARAIWRRLAPLAAREGTLSAVSAPLLAALCSRLARMAAHPDHVQDQDIARVSRLAKQLGVN